MQVAELFAKLGLQVDKKSWSVGNDVIAGLGKALVAWAGFKAVQGIAGWITDTIAWGDAAVKTAQKLGITAEAVQELGYVAGQSGTSGEALTAALARLSAGMSDVAKTGKGPTADGLRAIGLSMKNTANVARVLGIVLTVGVGVVLGARLIMLGLPLLQEVS